MPKTTNADLLERVEFVQELLCTGHPYGVIKQKVRDQFGKMHHTTIGRLVLRAREAFAKEARRQDLDALRWEQVALCKSIIADLKARTIDRLKASERIACLLGLDMPARIEVTDKTPKDPIRIDFDALRAEQGKAYCGQTN